MSTLTKVILGVALFTFFTLFQIYTSPNNNVAKKNVINNFTSMKDSIRRSLSSAIEINGIDETTLPELVLDPQQALVESILSTKDATNSIYHFINTHLTYIKHDVMILYWDSDGNLDNSSLKDTNRGWWETKPEYDNTEPSEFGKVALLLNTDIISFPDWETSWSVKPPVPLLSHSIPRKFEDSDHIVLPNPYDKGGFSGWLTGLAEVAESNNTFYDRKNVIVYRGNFHGGDTNRQKIAQISAEGTNNEWLDAAITNDTTYMSEEDMAANYKYQLDIGGVSGTTWGALRWKMCTDDVVFKVDSWAKDWWHDMIKPYKHYIPVKEDLSDLHAAYEWAESHPEEVDIIREKGKAKCQETMNQEAIWSYEKNVMYNLQPASKEIIEEVKLIREGLLSL